MKVSKHITGKSGDWEFTFDRARYNDWTIMNTGIPWPEQIKAILPRLRATSGVAFDDGTPIPHEDIAAQEAPIEVYLAMLGAWQSAVVDSFRSEAEEKNEVTPPSSDSSPVDSTSRG